LAEVFHSGVATESLLANRACRCSVLCGRVEIGERTDMATQLWQVGLGRKVATLRIRMGSFAVSSRLSCSSSLVAPDRTLSTFSLPQMPPTPISIGLKLRCCEPIAAPARSHSAAPAVSGWSRMGGPLRPSGGRARHGAREATRPSGSCEPQSKETPKRLEVLPWLALLCGVRLALAGAGAVRSTH
jgi:hypothetical protein